MLGTVCALPVVGPSGWDRLVAWITSLPPHLEVAHHVGVLQCAQGGHLAHDAGVAVRGSRLADGQPDLFDGVFAPVKPAAGQEKSKERQAACTEQQVTSRSGSI